MGEYIFRDIVVPDGIPAIVSKELFDRVQAKLVINRKAPARHKAEDDYLLTTKLFCGYCGAYLCGECGTSKTGVVHHYYKCVSVKKHRTTFNFREGTETITFADLQAALQRDEKSSNMNSVGVP